MTRSPSVPSALSFAAAAGFAAGCLDLALARWLDPGARFATSEILPTLGISAGFTTLLQAAAWLLVLRAAARRIAAGVLAWATFLGLAACQLVIALATGPGLGLTPAARVGVLVEGGLVGLLALLLLRGRGLSLDSAVARVLVLGWSLLGGYGAASLVGLVGAFPGLRRAGLVVGALLVLPLARRLLGERPRRHALASALSLALAIASSWAAASWSSEPTVPERARLSSEGPPRVILVVVDTLRRDALTAVAGSGAASRGLAGLVTDSLEFRSARTPAPWTLPAVTSLMTGVSPLVHAATHRDSALPHGVPTLAERLSRAGYRTAAIGHNFVLSPERGIARGFDEYRFSKRQRLPPRTLGFVLEAHLRRRPADYSRADVLTTSALSWIEGHADEPFFLWLHYYEPHLEYAPPPAYRPAGPAPPGLGPVCHFEDYERIRGGYLEPTLEERAWIEGLYRGEVDFLAENLGRLLLGLRELGLYDDSLIVLTSDHGEEFWEHEGFEHGHTVFEELLSVPLFLKLPGARQGARIDRPVSLESVAPTVLTACGLAFEGEDFSAPSLLDSAGRVVDGEPDASFVSTGTLYYQDRVAIVQGGWKYVWFLRTGKEELYDLTADPGETRSVTVEHADRLQELRAALEEERERASRLRERLGVGEGERAVGGDALDVLRDIGYAK